MSENLQALLSPQVSRGTVSDVTDTVASAANGSADFGANSWLVEEMFEQYRLDPASVGESWREFFSDYKSRAEVAAAPARPAAAPAPAAPVAPAPVSNGSSSNGAVSNGAAPAPAHAPTDALGEPIKGAGVAIVTNMERSLTVPTATSFRNVPAKLLEVNRKVINGYRTRSGQNKVSFTHVIGYAIVRAIADAVPVMNSSFVEGPDGKPRVVRHAHVNVGLAVDVAKSDGSRSLVVPVLRDADTFNFAEFVVAYDELVRKVKQNKLQVADFQGATVSITNPGTGTVQSVPRLMPGQGVIVGVGSIDYPAEFQGADERALGTLGVSKVVTVTSTYDHRIIQGAESGLFLKRVHELLLGEHGFYEDVFKSLGVPYEAVKWRSDVNPLDSDEARLQQYLVPRDWI